MIMMTLANKLRKFLLPLSSIAHEATQEDVDNGLAAAVGDKVIDAPASDKQDVIEDLDEIRSKAMSALQEHQDISGKLDIEVFNNTVSTQNEAIDNLNTQITTFLGTDTETLAVVKELIVAADESEELNTLVEALNNWAENECEDIDE